MKFWVYLNGEVPGCLTPAELANLPGFSDTTLVCPAEGEILEKNWRRAGEFSELIPCLQKLAAQSQPMSPAEPPAPLDVEKLLDSANHRLFSHVSDLMKELEHHREEKALIASLQRQVMELKDQVQTARERASKLEDLLARITELEETKRKYEDRLLSLEAALRSRDEAVAELRAQYEKARGDLETAKRNLSEAANDLAIRNRLVEKLNNDITSKEVNLAKAISIIRRLEEGLNTIQPETPEPEARQDAAATAPSEPAAGAAPEPAQLPPPQGAVAQKALVDFLKRMVNRPEV